MYSTIFSMWTEYNSYALKTFKNDTFSHLETLYLWRSRHRCFTHMFCSTKLSHLSAAQRAVFLFQSGSQQVPFAKGCLSSSLPHHREMLQKSSGCTLAGGDGDGFTLTSPLHSALTLWFGGRAPQKSLQKPFQQHPGFPVRCERQSRALTAGSSTSLQVTPLICIAICLMTLKTAERSGFTAVSPGFKFSCKTCK